MTKAVIRTEADVLLEVKNLNAGYGFLQILRDVSISIDEGEFVCLLGPNGAGKSTTMKSISGLVSPMSGQIVFRGEDIAGLAGNKVCRKGISYISEEMNLFVNMSVHENLMMGAYTIKDKAFIKKQMEFIYSLFPRLEERRNQLAGTMSGGERKMLGIARGLMPDPKLLLVDEPSFGLAPNLTHDVFLALQKLNEGGLTLLVVEQNVTKTLKFAKRGYVLEHGRIELTNSSDGLASDPHVRKVFLGV